MLFWTKLFSIVDLIYDFKASIWSLDFKDGRKFNKMEDTKHIRKAQNVSKYIPMV